MRALVAEFKNEYSYDYDAEEYPPFGPGEIIWTLDESAPFPDLLGWLWLTSDGSTAPVTDQMDLGATFDYTAIDSYEYTVYEWTVDGDPLTSPLLPMGPQEVTAPSSIEEITAEIEVPAEEGSTLEPLFPSGNGLGVQITYSDSDAAALTPLDAAAQAYAAANGGVVPEYNYFDEENQDENYYPLVIITTFTLTITVEDSCGAEATRTFTVEQEHSPAV